LRFNRYVQFLFNFKLKITIENRKVIFFYKFPKILISLLKKFSEIFGKLVSFFISYFQENKIKKNYLILEFKRPLEAFISELYLNNFYLRSCKIVAKIFKYKKSINPGYKIIFTQKKYFFEIKNYFYLKKEQEMFKKIKNFGYNSSLKSENYNFRNKNLNIRFQFLDQKKGEYFRQCTNGENISNERIFIKYRKFQTLKKKNSNRLIKTVKQNTCANLCFLQFSFVKKSRSKKFYEILEVILKVNIIQKSFDVLKNTNIKFLIKINFLKSPKLFLYIFSFSEMNEIFW